MSLDHLTIQGWLPRQARFRPEHPALIFHKADHKAAVITLSYRELNHRVNRLGRALQSAGVKKGHKVATLLSNCVELYEIYWACAKLGAVAVPLSPLLRGKGLAGLINDADTAVLVTKAEMIEHLEPVFSEIKGLRRENIWLINTEAKTPFSCFHQKKSEESEAEPEVEVVKGCDPYNIVYSSGTTGKPKGIVISHEVRALYGSLFASAFRLTPESVILHSGSIVFNGAFLTLMPCLFLGATFVLHEGFDPDQVIGSLQNEKVTHSILVPSQIISCLQRQAFSREFLPSLEYILSVGAPLLLQHKHDFNQRLPGIFYELYGLTEGFMTVLDRTESLSKAGSVGRPPAFMDIKICDDDGRELKTGEIGEIVGRGPLLMTGYHKNPALTAEALREGWLFTGDLGKLDSDGYLHLTGRKKDLIISGGVNVYPVDIEEILAEHPEVKDVAVFGAPHEEWGETPVAAVVLRKVESGAEPSLCKELQDWAHLRLGARFQKIHDVWFVPELPRNVAGKILKMELRQNYSLRKEL